MKVGTVLETNQWKIMVYAPPREHGPPHVHVVSKSSGVEVKITLFDIRVIGTTSFDRATARAIIVYVYENHDFLVEAWEALHGKKEKT